MSPKRQVTAMAGKKDVEWYTPRWLIRQLEFEFGAFTLDPCASSAGVAVVPSNFYNVELDGLLQPWAPHRVFMNPPYGDKVIGQWMEKARTEAHHGALVVCLVPSYTDSRWWHAQVIGKAEVRYIKGRLRFGGPEDKRNDAPFAWKCPRRPHLGTSASWRSPLVSDPVRFVTCPECGFEQADMGAGVACEQCGAGPMPQSGTAEPAAPPQIARQRGGKVAKRAAKRPPAKRAKPKRGNKR